MNRTNWTALLTVLAVLGSATQASKASAAGGIDSTFGANGQVFTPFGDPPATPGAPGSFSGANALLQQSDGRIVAVGCGFDYDAAAGHYRYASDFLLARYVADGRLDPSFGDGGQVYSGVDPGGVAGVNHVCAQDAALQPDGKIVAAGWALGGTAGFAVARYNPDGSLDPSFGDGGFVIEDGRDETNTPNLGRASAVTIQAGGKIVVAGDSQSSSEQSMAVARFNPDGSLDRTFAGSGWTLVSLDASASAQAVLQDQASRIVLAGGASREWADTPPGTGFRGRVAVARLLPDGNADNTFNGSGVATSSLGAPADSAFGTSLVEQPDGKLIVGASAGLGTGRDEFGLARFDTDGQLDPAFGVGGAVRGRYCCDSGTGDPTISNDASAIALQPDGKIVFTGLASSGCTGCHGISSFGVGRVNPDGTLDTSFSGDGMTVMPPGGSPPRAYLATRAVLRQTNGRIAVAGSANDSSDPIGSGFALVRFIGGPIASGDADGDGVSDAVDECPFKPRFTASGCLRFVAIGDSVSAGFGYDANGAPVSPQHIFDVCIDDSHRPDCESPALVSYPAIYGRSGAPTFWANFAESGSTPANWTASDSRKVNRVLAARPDLTALTLGANPLLKYFMTDGQQCARQDEEKARTCIRAKLEDEGVQANLETVLRRLLTLPSNHVVVFHYHDTVPLALSFGARVTILLDELNSVIDRAVDDVKQDPGSRGRVLWQDPGPFDLHHCDALRPGQRWVLQSDSCIHPNARGMAQFARRLDQAAKNRFRLYP